jgi:hypothetical protein
MAVVVVGPADSMANACAAYGCTLLVQLAALLLDLGFNTAATLLYRDDNTALLLYM